MNNSIFFSILCAIVFVLMSATTNAALIDRGGGLIYDSEQNLTWTQNASMSGPLAWDAAMMWADNLVFGGFDDWRLPTTTQFDDPTCSGDVRGEIYNEVRLDCQGGEMELLTYLYDPWNNELFQYIDGDGKVRRYVNRTRYWTATPYRDGTDPCIYYPAYDVPCNLPTSEGDHANNYWQWGFTGWGGINGPAFKTTLSGGNPRYAWAVRDGDVAAVPVPPAIYLFGSGLLGLLGMVKRKAG